jgi:hypothetical protein
VTRAERRRSRAFTERGAQGAPSREARPRARREVRGDAFAPRDRSRRRLHRISASDVAHRPVSSQDTPLAEVHRARDLSPARSAACRASTGLRAPARAAKASTRSPPRRTLTGEHQIDPSGFVTFDDVVSAGIKWFVIGGHIASAALATGGAGGNPMGGIGSAGAFGLRSATGGYSPGTYQVQGSAGGTMAGSGVQGVQKGIPALDGSIPDHLRGPDERVACAPCRTPAAQQAARAIVQGARWWGAQAQRAWNAARPYAAHAGQRLADAASRLWSGARAGVDIVGKAGHTGLRPTQLSVDRGVVDRYAAQLRAGQRIDPIHAVEVPGGHRYIIEGHHRYVASQQTGIPVEVVVKRGGGPVGFDWKDVAYEAFTP